MLLLKRSIRIFLSFIVPGKLEDVGTYTATVKNEEEEIIVDLTWTRFGVRNCFRFLKKNLASNGSFFDSLSKAQHWRTQDSSFNHFEVKNLGGLLLLPAASCSGTESGRE